MEKTPRDLVHRVVAHHGPILAKQVATRCADVGYTNPRSTYAVLYNAKRAGTLVKDDKDRWTAGAR